ncbi:serine/threonine protein kinase [Myxococcus sp. CA033]|nr:serine/threonine protein kinase [Myxococcus sp. CA033]
MGYTVERRLGSGGFGAVYLASLDGQRAALKFLDLSRVKDRVEREVSILLRLSHPNVVGIRGLGYWPSAAPEFAVIAMEFVEGRELGTWANEENPSARQVTRMVLDVARALAASHEAGVIHRDVKEANVMVRSDGVAKLVDFGVGDYEGAREITSDVLPPGTPDYRSPEAWTYFRQHVKVPGACYEPGPSDDLWALGVVLYVLLTTHRPFEGEHFTLPDVVIANAAVSPREVNERVPEALSDVCLRLLAKTPATRTPSAQALCVELEAALQRADDAWDVPLCDAYGEDTATTDGGPDKDDDLGGLEEWVNELRKRPRRGRRPQKKPLPLADGGTATERVPVRARSSWRRGVVVAVALVLVALVAAWSWRTSRVAGAVPTRQEVARLDRHNTSVSATASQPRTEATPAVVAVPAMLPEATTVMMEKTETPMPPKPAKKGAGIMSRAVAAAVACSALGCPGTQVRPPPPPAPCPSGAVEAMDARGIETGDYHGATFGPRGGAQVISVKDGATELLLLGEWKRMPTGTIFSGRLTVSDRVYGRFTRARTPGGESFPVCLELLAEGNVKGLERESGDDSPTSARVFSTGEVRAVREFE